MPDYNNARREARATVVYAGPGLSGKTTNLEYIQAAMGRGELVGINTEGERTVFYDLLPVKLGELPQGWRLTINLKTVPGQIQYIGARKLVLRKPDAVVFVADSSARRLEANRYALDDLQRILIDNSNDLRRVPLVMQYNKRDLPNALSLPELEKEVNKIGVKSFESVATTGLGVEETLKGITQLVLTHLVKKYGLEGAEPLEKEIQILNVRTPPSETAANSLWDDEDEPFGEPAPAAAPAAAPAQAYAAATATASPAGESEFDLDDASDETIPLVATELLPAAPAAMSSFANPFDDVTDYFTSSSATPIEVPTTSIEIPLPQGILESLPVLGEQPPARTVAPSPVASPAPAPAPDRRSSDGLVKEVNIPLNLSMEELRQHRRLRLKITLDVNLLP